MYDHQSRLASCSARLHHPSRLVSCRFLYIYTAYWCRLHHQSWLVSYRSHIQPQQAGVLLVSFTPAQQADDTRSVPDTGGHYVGLPSSVPDIGEHYAGLPSSVPDIGEHYAGLPSSVPDIGGHYAGLPSSVPDIGGHYAGLPGCLSKPFTYSTSTKSVLARIFPLSPSLVGFCLSQ